jgi:hypothetical protein
MLEKWADEIRLEKSGSGDKLLLKNIEAGDIG